MWTSCNNSKLVIIINTRCEIIADKLLHTNYHIYIFGTLDTSLFDVGNALRKYILMQCFALEACKFQKSYLSVIILNDYSTGAS